ncbi:hypothetical protein EW146_g6122 [Bondarzewia mesenterica]|uniref:Uncharacterized protein n=1 Tax=Bondarzewia mesenterica TaxID=1095465 RepID=A0A4S4LQ47_9AGAM|nr:hypothetical protein EW146_g6122 [Bondarzewia mesenterica]
MIPDRRLSSKFVSVEGVCFVILEEDDTSRENVTSPLTSTALEVVLEDVATLGLSTVFLDHNARAANNLARVALPVNLAETSPGTEDLGVSDLDEGDLVGSAESLNELDILGLRASLDKHAKIAHLKSILDRQLSLGSLGDLSLNLDGLNLNFISSVRHPKVSQFQSLAFLHALDCQEPHSDAVWDISWTATDTVISVSADGSIKHWDSTSGQILRSLPPHTLGIVSLSVSPNGKHALYNTIDGLTCLWDLENGEIVGKHESYARTGSEATEPSWSVSLNPKGGSYASTGGSGSITIHSAEPGSFGQRLSTLTSTRNKFGMQCRYSPDGFRIALATESGQMYIYDVQSSALTATFTSHAMAVRSIAWSPDSQLLLSASEDKRLILHDVRTSSSAGKPGSGAVASLSGHSSWVLSTDISPDGRLALSGSADKTIKVWDLSARAAVSTIQDTGEVWGVSWRPRPSPNNSAGAFVSGGEDGLVRWWRAAGAG